MAGLVELIFILVIGLGWGLWELRSLRRAKTTAASPPSESAAAPGAISPPAASGTAASPEPPEP